jgi:hypothetical protein
MGDNTSPNGGQEYVKEVECPALILHERIALTIGL